MSLAAVSTEALIEAAWHAGDLRYLLHDGQIELREMVRESDDIIDVILAARRYGKSWGGVVDSAEEIAACEEHGVRDRWLIAAQTQKDAEAIIAPHVEDVMRDAPKKYRPKFNAQKLRWTWEGGCVLQLAGTDGRNRDRLRGRGARRVLVDEAGFHDDFEYLIKSVLLPQALNARSRFTIRGYEHPSLARFGPPGKVLLMSTPSRSPEHPFVAEYCRQAEERGRLRIKTIYDAPHITREAADRFIAESGGMQSTNVRREYFCERIVEESRAIVPEFSQRRDALVHVRAMPIHFRCFTVADFGFSDMSVIGFWEHHFDDDVLYQRDELVFRNQGTNVIAPAVAAKELTLWRREPNERWGDPNSSQSTATRESEIVINDFVIYHGQRWAPTNRDRLQPAVNALRVACAQGSVAWHPDCTVTIAHMGGGVWNDQRSSFARSGEHGHFDGIAQAMYAHRHVDRTTSPYPNVPTHLQHGDAFVRHDVIHEKSTSGKLERALGGGKRR